MTMGKWQHWNDIVEHGATFRAWDTAMAPRTCKEAKLHIVCLCRSSFTRWSAVRRRTPRCWRTSRATAAETTSSR